MDLQVKRFLSFFSLLLSHVKGEKTGGELKKKHNSCNKKNNVIN